jgi:hypothetical protein
VRRLVQEQGEHDIDGGNGGLGFLISVDDNLHSLDCQLSDRGMVVVIDFPVHERVKKRRKGERDKGRLSCLRE